MKSIAGRSSASAPTGRFFVQALRAEVISEAPRLVTSSWSRSHLRTVLDRGMTRLPPRPLCAVRALPAGLDHDAVVEAVLTLSAFFPLTVHASLNDDFVPPRIVTELVTRPIWFCRYDKGPRSCCPTWPAPPAPSSRRDHMRLQASRT